MITENKYIDLAHTIMGNHIDENGGKNQITAMIDFAEEYHRLKTTKSAEPDLLSACLECIEIIDRVPNACGLSEDEINKLPHVIKLRDAIKKAEIQNVQPD
jgi:hypothetical protein